MDPLDASAIGRLYGRSLLCTLDYSEVELDALLSVAGVFEALDRRGIALDLLGSELAYALFFDNSTRTKSAWAGAAARLGAHPVIVDGSSTQVSHGETAAETGAMLGMNAHALGIRHDLILGEGRRFLADVKRGVDGYLAATGAARVVPVVNLQCDLDHPTQALADLMWLRERFGSIRGKQIAITWAYSPSYAKPLSVPQGLLMLLTRFGAHVRLAHPPGYELLDECLEAASANSERTGGSFTRLDSIDAARPGTQAMDAAFEGADVVYPKSWGPQDLMRERAGAGAAEMAGIERRMLARNAEHRGWICDEARMATTRGGEALYMHCLPADIGDEVSAAVMSRARLDLAREANKKVYVIMALLATAKVPELAARLEALR